MKHSNILLGAIWCLSSICVAQNPIIQTCFTADPAPLVHNDTVYLYAGHDEDDAPDVGFKMLDWKCYTSTDMKNWTDKGAILSTADFPWAVSNSAWAPQCIFRNGKFYFYSPITQKSNGKMSIAVAVSDSPTGPFVDVLGKPMIANSHEDIDPTVFIDDDGQAYLYWGNPNLYYVKLNPDMISYSGEIVKVASKPKNYQEGPWLYKRKGTYYLAYSSTCCPEGIGYCTSTSPMGPWDYRGLIQKGQPTSAGNHPGIIDYKGRSYLFGFNAALPGAGNQRRSICADELLYNEDGSISTFEWSKTGPAQIHTFDPYKRSEAETIAGSFGVKTAKDSKVGVYATKLHNNDYIKVGGVDFKKGAKSFQASVASATGGGSIEIRLDQLDGTLIGTCTVKNTGGAMNWTVQSCKVIKLKGIHDVYFVFKGGDRELLNFDWWKFSKKK